jgi:uncharacterized protein DUF1761
MPHLHLNPLAIVVSVVVSFALGSVWYGVLFVKAWQRAMGFDAEKKPSGAEIAKGSILNLIGTALTAFVLAHLVVIWRPSVWGLTTPDFAPWVYGAFAGFLVWLGFVVPVLFNGVAFERKPWKVFFISAVFQLISLEVMAMVLAYWR